MEEVVFNLKKAGFQDLSFSQTIFHNLDEIKKIEPIKEGYGEGSFVVIKAVKRRLSLMARLFIFWFAMQ
jgi:hypothetical protein